MTGNFIQNTIFTDYALNKINKYLYHGTVIHDSITNEVIPDTDVAPLPFNFTKITISNMYSPLTQNTTVLANEIYELPVTKVEQVSDSTFIIYSAITADIIDLKIWQLGVYDTDEEGDHLFVFGNVDSYKPNTDYELVINLEFNLDTEQFYKGKLNVVVNEPDHIPVEEGYKLSYTFADVADFLETPITRNRQALSGELDEFLAIQNIFEEERLNNSLNHCILDTVKYLEYLNSNINGFEDSFFFQDSDNMSYTLSNLNKDNSYLTVTNKLFTSTNDNTGFTNGAGTLILTGNYSNGEGIIINKVNIDTLASNFQLEVFNEQIMLTIYDISGTGYLRYIYKPANWYNLYENEFSHIFTFDGITIKYYLNGEEMEGVVENNNFITTTNLTDMVLTNNVSATSEFNPLQNTKSINFFNTCLTAQQVKRLSKITDYLI